MGDYTEYTYANRGFDTWPCTFITYESKAAREVYRQRRINVANGQQPPIEMQSDGNVYMRVWVSGHSAFYAAAHLMKGMSREQFDTWVVAKRLEGLF